MKNIMIVSTYMTKEGKVMYMMFDCGWVFKGGKLVPEKILYRSYSASKVLQRAVDFVGE